MAGILEIDIDPDGGIQLQARLFLAPGARTTSVPDRLRRLVGLVRSLSGQYHAHLSSDGRLIGQEKIELIRCLEEVMIEILGLRNILGGSTDFSIPVPRTRYSIAFTFADDAIAGSGQVGRLQLQKERFSHWLSRVPHRRMSILLQNAGDALRDGVLTDDEKAVLIRDVNLMFLGFLLSRESILRGQMD